jgi:GT2 family glycosyltransferase
MTTDSDGNSETTVMVALCTYRRNAELERLLEALLLNDVGLGEHVRLGVSVADDNVDGRARDVVTKFADRFGGDVVYVRTGSGNISIARNAAIAGALEADADWVAMTDDDCIVPPDWVESFLVAQSATGADIITGTCALTPPPGAPEWLVDEPFYESAAFRFPHLAPITVAATNNSMIRAESLRSMPEWRFDESLGVLGGEDMVFFRSAAKAGVSIVYSESSTVVGQESIERGNLRYQLRAHLWLGNTEFVTSDRIDDVSRVRWIARGGYLALTGLLRPVGRLVRFDPPQFRYALAMSAQGLGRALGALGFKLRHH